MQTSCCFSTNRLQTNVLRIGSLVGHQLVPLLTCIRASSAQNDGPYFRYIPSMVSSIGRRFKAHLTSNYLTILFAIKFYHSATHWASSHQQFCICICIFL